MPRGTPDFSMTGPEPRGWPLSMAIPRPYAQRRFYSTSRIPLRSPRTVSEKNVAGASAISVRPDGTVLMGDHRGKIGDGRFQYLG
jgi:hypothetical protein